MTQDENLRGFHESFAKNFVVPQIKFWLENVFRLPATLTVPKNQLEEEYYREMKKVVENLLSEFTPPYTSSHLLWDITITAQEVEWLKGIIGDNYKLLKDQVQKKKNLGISFLSTDEEEGKLESIEIYVKKVAPNLSDALEKSFFAVFNRDENSSNDKINRALRNISPHLIDMRKGMWDALKSNSFDSGRQAVHSARELIDQVLKEGAQGEFSTRKERAVSIIQQNREGDISESDIEVIDASWKLIDAEHKKMLKLTHGRSSALLKEARGSVEAAERILHLLFS